jgi:tetratricopeptide (TPR) repeat protein
MLERIRAVMVQAPVIVLTENPMLFKKERTVNLFFDILYLPVSEELLSRTILAAFQEIPLMYLRYYQWANILRLSGKREDAKRMYEAAMSLNPSFLPPAVDLCWLSYREKDFKRAEAVMRRVPGHEHIPEFLQMKGKIAFMRGELQRAERYYKRALSLAPFSLKMIIEYGRVLAKSHAYKEILQLALRKAPEFLEMKEKMRRAVRRAVAEGNDEESYTASRMALRYFPGDREFQDVYTRTARALGIDERKEEAER